MCNFLRTLLHSRRPFSFCILEMKNIFSVVLKMKMSARALALRQKLELRSGQRSGGAPANVCVISSYTAL